MIPLGLWHCFGVRDEIVDLELVREMLDASGTQLLPLNTNQGELLIGHGKVTWDHFKLEAEYRELIPCLNINLQTTSKDAVKRAKKFSRQTGITLIKLEVLTSDLTDSNDIECMKATFELATSGFDVMPLVRSEVAVAEVAEFVPLVRVMGSPIGSGLGITDPVTVYNACNYDIPVVLDGGIGTLDHARQAMRLGCSGFLVNSALFVHPEGPVAALKEYASLKPVFA